MSAVMNVRFCLPEDKKNSPPQRLAGMPLVGVNCRQTTRETYAPERTTLMRSTPMLYKVKCIC